MVLKSRMANNLMDVPDADYSARQSSQYDQGRYAIALRLLQQNMEFTGSRIFDFGCGDGSFMRKLNGSGAQVFGCDPSSELAEKANAVCGGVEVLENLDGLSVVIALNVTSFMEPDQQRRFWVAMPKALRPGGFFLHAVMNSWVGAERRKFSANPKDFPIMLEGIGLKEIDRDFYGYYPIIGTNTRIYDLGIWIPKAIKARRCSMYFSLSQKV